MTHEELLDKINEDERTAHLYGYSGHQGLLKYFNSLREVVELHRPALDKEMNEFADDVGRFGCAGCGFDFNYGTWEVSYPCRTIQAIKKELK